ncbi:MAG: hypothetical protein PHF44_00360 [Candidatus Pacebacteria bacterium]|nr:hypothetical protein [Candidatus Paceibacterota bacterium]
MNAKIVAEKDGSLTMSLTPDITGMDLSKIPESMEQLFESLKQYGCACIMIPTGWRNPYETFWFRVKVIEKK